MNRSYTWQEIFSLGLDMGPDWGELPAVGSYWWSWDRGIHTQTGYLNLLLSRKQLHKKDSMFRRNRNSEAICHIYIYTHIVIHLFTKDAGFKYVHVLSDCNPASEHPPEVHLICSGSWSADQSPCGTVSVERGNWNLTVCYWKLAIEIVDLPIKNGDFPVRYVDLPEGMV